MRELIDFSRGAVTLKCINTIDCDEYNRLFIDKPIDIIFHDFSLEHYTQTIRLSINLDNITILKLAFGYTEKFFGFNDKWENAVIKIVKQEKLITFLSSMKYREIPMSLFTLYDETHDFMIESRLLYQWDKNQ